MPQPTEKLRALVEGYLSEFSLTSELGSLEAPMRYALGGKRVRPVLCLATGDAIGAAVESLLPAAAAVELVHSFSLVHDDLPSLDDDNERRGAPSVWAQYGEATAILAGKHPAFVEVLEQFREKQTRSVLDHPDPREVL